MNPTVIPEDKFDHVAAAALGRFVAQVLDIPSKRAEFRSDPIKVAQDEEIIPVLDNEEATEKLTRVILTLAELSPAEMRLLSDLNRRLIAEDLFVETGNPPLMVY
ncbi:MAG: hypothetical protein ACRDG9_11960 [Actinomycetota bacterium]